MLELLYASMLHDFATQLGETHLPGACTCCTGRAGHAAALAALQNKQFDAYA